LNHLNFLDTMKQLDRPETTTSIGNVFVFSNVLNEYTQALWEWDTVGTSYPSLVGSALGRLETGNVTILIPYLSAVDRPAKVMGHDHKERGNY